MIKLSTIKETNIYNGEKPVCSISGAGKLYSCMEKKETRTFSNTMHRNKLKMDYRIKCKTEHDKTLKGKHRQNTL